MMPARSDCPAARAWRRLRVPLALLASTAAGVGDLRAGSFDVTRLDELLSRYAVDGRLRYGRLLGERPGLDDFVRSLGLIDPQEIPDGAERKSFWLNAYNALVIHTLIGAQPISRVTDVPAFFSDPRHDIGGNKYSLDRIVAEELRKPFHDPRIHFALVPGSLSGPSLPGKAYRAEGLDETLDERARAFLARPEAIAIDAGARVVHVSPLFEWYAADFIAGGTPREPEEAWREFLLKYAPAPVRNALKESPPFRIQPDQPYDWSLNDVLVAKKTRFEWPWTRAPVAAPSAAPAAAEDGPGAPSPGGSPSPSP